MKFTLSRKIKKDVSGDDILSSAEEEVHPKAERKEKKENPKKEKKIKIEKPKREKKEKLPKQKKAKKKKGALSPKSFKITSKPFFILSIGDEGAILTYLQNKKVEGRWFANVPSEDNFEVFSKAISAQPNASLMVVLDTMDQIYSSQTLPPVNKMSLPGLLKRRMKREFGDMELKGNYLLERLPTKEWQFIIFAIDQREDVTSWLSWVSKQPVRPLGIRALPLEMTQLAHVLYSSKQTEVQAEHEWKFLVSHNKVSGFRQVIVHHENMVLTRLSQPLDGGDDVQAGVVEQEITSTLEYLKRIGLKSYQDVHLNIIASEEINRLVNVKKIDVGSHEFFTPYTVSQKFLWDDITQPEDRFGDVFLGTFSLTNKKSIAKLWTKPLEKLSKIYKISPAIRLIGALVVFGALGSSVMSAIDWWQSSDDVEMARRQSTQSNTQLEELKKTVDLPPEELDKALVVLDFYKRIKQEELNPKGFLLDLSSAFVDLPEDMLLQNIEWNESPQIAPVPGAPPVQPQPNAAAVPQGKEVPVMGTLAISITVPKNIKSEALQNRSKAVLDKIQPYIPHYQLMLSGAPGVGMNDTLSINLTVKPEETAEGNKTEVIRVSFTGKEYIPEPVFEP